MFFVCVVISDEYLFQEIVPLNPCFIFSKNIILSLIDKVTTGVIYLKCYSSCLYVTVAATVRAGGLAFGFLVTAGVIDISDIIHSFDHNKSSSILQLVNGKSRDIQKLLKYLNGTTTSASIILLLLGVLPINFVLHSKDLPVTFCRYLSYY